MPHYIWQKKFWNNFTWDEEKLLPLISRVRLEQGELLAKIKSLQVVDSIRAQAEVLVTETTRTAQIEGEIYDPLAVRSSVNQKLGLLQFGLPHPQQDIDGLVTMLLDATTHADDELTAKKIQSWHAALFPTGYSGLRKIRTGAFRDDQNGPMQVISGAVGREKVHYEAPPAKNLVVELKTFFQWWKTSQDQTEGIIRAGIAHFYFVTIHPFEDGNGRIARALTDMALAQDDHLQKRYYSLSDQIVTERKLYYQILEESQRGNSDITDWLVWFIECFGRSLHRSSFLLKHILEKSTYWQKHQVKIINERQRKVLNKVLDVGTSNFSGGLTTRKYEGITKTSRATAYRELSDLVEKKMLRQKGGGRSVRYELI